MDSYGQDNMYEAGMIQRIALYATLGLTLNALGQGLDDVGFWMILALFWAGEHVARTDGYDNAIELSQAVLHKANEMLQEAKQIRTIKGHTDDNA